MVCTSTFRCGYLGFCAQILVLDLIKKFFIYQDVMLILLRLDLGVLINCADHRSSGADRHAVDFVSARCGWQDEKLAI